MTGIDLLTIVLLVVILTASLRSRTVMVTLPEIRLPTITLPPIAVDARLVWPEQMNLSVTTDTKVAGTKSVDEPIPEEMLTYIEADSELWARSGRQRRLRELRQELGNWPSAFAALQREDNS